MTYICKCGRKVEKAASSKTTGNRDVADCVGCPYRMPYGPFEYVTGEGVRMNVQGYECRMSQAIDYETDYIGNTKNTNSLSIKSLDLDFLDAVQAWVDTRSGGDLNCSFDRNELRPADFAENGQIRLGISCSQNKKGIAAKTALLDHFFDETGLRKDLNPEQEKAKILADIQRGIERAKEDTTQCKSTEPNEANAPRTAAAATEDASAVALYEAAETPTTQTDADSAAPAFDYAGMDGQTVADLHMAEHEVLHGKAMAMRGLRRMADGVAIAHEALCGARPQCERAHNNQHSEDTFQRWCESVGLGKTTAYKLLQVSRLYDTSTPSQQQLLQELSPSLLYAAAKPSAPEELVQGVKQGDITTHKQYQDLLAQYNAERAAREKAEQDAAMERKEQEDANAAAMRYKAECDRRAQEEQRLEGLARTAQLAKQTAEAAAKDAEVRARAAEKQAAEAAKELQGARQVAEAAKMRGDKYKAEAEAARSAPVAAAVDLDEVQRRAEALAQQMIAEQAETADDAAHEKQMHAYDAIIHAGRSVREIWVVVQSQLPLLPNEMQAGALTQWSHELNKIQGEIVQCMPIE